jgi:hypothetical protein
VSKFGSVFKGKTKDTGSRVKPGTTRVLNVETPKLQYLHCYIIPINLPTTVIAAEPEGESWNPGGCFFSLYRSTNIPQINGT